MPHDIFPVGDISAQRTFIVSIFLLEHSLYGHIIILQLSPWSRKCQATNRCCEVLSKVGIKSPWLAPPSASDPFLLVSPLRQGARCQLQFTPSLSREGPISEQTNNQQKKGSTGETIVLRFLATVLLCLSVANIMPWLYILDVK